MREALRAMLTDGLSLGDLLAKLDGCGVDGDTIRATVDVRARPYLAHTLVGWGDGPPSSNVIAIISGKSPTKDQWRRFTLTHTGTWRCELDAFPTPFNNPEAPLAPGIPPGASRPVSAIEG